MAKRKKENLDRFSDIPLVRRCSTCNVSKDRISDLPDCILTNHILPRLPFEQVAKTSILSHRWRHLHLQTSVMQFFPNPHMFDEVESLTSGRGRRLISQEPPSKSAVRCRKYRAAMAVMEKYAKWVNGAIAATNSNGTDGCGLVRLCVHFPWSVFNHIDSWLKFALGDKGVEELELRSFIDPYNVRITKRPSDQNQLSLLPKLQMLKSLTLCQVPMTSVNLEHMLLECVFLERLHLTRLLSNESRNEIRITGPVSSLKYVCVNDFDYYPTSIVVSAHTPDLVSLRYPGFARISPIKFAPRLIDLSVGSFSHYEFDLSSHRLFNYVSQLHSLHLDIANWKMVKHWLPCLPDLSGLKRLTLTISPSKGTAVRVFRCMISLINAAKCLQYLTLNVRARYFLIPTESEECADLHIPSLRVIEFDRFEGTSKQCQLVEYVVKGVASLHRLILDSRNTSKKHRTLQSELETWRRCVLEPILPSEAKLILLNASEYDDMMNYYKF